MNPGLMEEAGNTARTLISGLSSVPVVLAILVFNILYMAGTFYTVHLSASRWERVFETTLKACNAR